MTILPALKVLAPILVGQAKHLLEEAPVSTAIDRTAQLFPELDALPESLGNWVNSQGFADILAELETGTRDFDEESICAAFKQDGKFFAGDDTDRLARDIVDRFLNELWSAVMQSPQGLAAYAAFAEPQLKMILASQQTLLTSQAQMLASQTEMLAILQAQTPLPTAPTSDSFMGLIQRIEDARSLMLQGKVKGAMSLLERIGLDYEQTEGKSEDVEFRLAINLSACLFQLGEIDSAIAQTERALQLKPADRHALVSRSILALEQGDGANALRLIRRARRGRLKDPSITAVYLRILHRTREHAEVEALASQKWVQRDPFCAVILGDIRYEEGGFEAAERLWRTAYEARKTNPGLGPMFGMDLAGAIMASVQRMDQADPVLPGLENAGRTARLEEAEQIIETGLSALEEQDFLDRVLDLRVNRGAVRSLLGRDQEALDDFEFVLLSRPHEQLALRNKAMLLLKQSRWDEALTAIHQLEDPAERARCEIPLGLGLLMSGKPTEAVEQIRKVLATRGEDALVGDLHVAEILMASLSQAQQREDAEEVISRVRAAKGDDPEVLALIARQRIRNGELDAALELLTAAQKTASGNLLDRVRITVADVHYMRREYSLAIPEYEAAVNTAHDSEWLRRYVWALVANGAIGKAHQIARGIRADGVVIPGLSEVEAIALESIGDLDGAREIYERLWERDRNQPYHQVRAAILDIRQGNASAASERLHTIPTSTWIEHPDAASQAAHILATQGDLSALELAYQVRRRHFSTAKAHVAYVEIAALLEPQIPKEAPGQVTVDCAVVIERAGDKRTVIVIDDPTADVQRGELISTSPLATALLGKMVNDSAVIQEGLADVTYQVVDIQSKYGYAMQETVREFSTMFPDEGGLQAVQFQGPGRERLMAILQQRQQLIQSTLGTYRQGGASLAVLASAVGLSRPEIQLGLTTNRDLRFVSSLKSQPQLAIEREVLSGTDVMVLDIPAVLGHILAGTETMVAERCSRVFVAQTALDELTQARSELERSPDRRMTVSGGEFVAIEMTQDAIDHRGSLLRKAEEFVRRIAIIAPANLALTADAERLPELSDLVGPAATTSILVAKEHGGVLQADDVVVTSVAEEMGISTASIQSVLADLETKGLLSKSQRAGFLGQLARSNYFFLSIDAPLIIEAIRANGLTPELHALVTTLRAPDCEEQSAVRTAAEVIKPVWITPELRQYGPAVLDLFLDSLIIGRGSRTLALLAATLSVMLALAPIHRDDVLQHIAAWAQSRGLVLPRQF